MIREWHLKRGFSDVGYHWVITADGTIQEGRPEEEIGAHVEGHNADSIGICLTGLSHFTEDQFMSLEDLLIILKDKYPYATLHGHREFNPHKTCPVFDYSEFVEMWDNE